MIPTFRLNLQRALRCVALGVLFLVLAMPVLATPAQAAADLSMLKKPLVALPETDEAPFKWFQFNEVQFVAAGRVGGSFEAAGFGGSIRAMTNLGFFTLFAKADISDAGLSSTSSIPTVTLPGTLPSMYLAGIDFNYPFSGNKMRAGLTYLKFSRFDLGSHYNADGLIYLVSTGGHTIIAWWQNIIFEDSQILKTRVGLDAGVTIYDALSQESLEGTRVVLTQWHTRAFSAHLGASGKAFRTRAGWRFVAEYHIRLVMTQAVANDGSGESQLIVHPDFTLTALVEMPWFPVAWYYEGYLGDIYTTLETGLQLTF